MIFAQIKDGLIVNTIVLDSSNDLSLFTSGFDYVLQIDQQYPRPGISWSFDGIQFIPPPIPSYGDGEDETEEELP